MRAFPLVENFKSIDTSAHDKCLVQVKVCEDAEATESCSQTMELSPSIHRKGIMTSWLEESKGRYVHFVQKCKEQAKTTTPLPQYTELQVFTFSKPFPTCSVASGKGTKESFELASCLDEAKLSTPKGLAECNGALRAWRILGGECSSAEDDESGSSAACKCMMEVGQYLSHPANSKGWWNAVKLSANRQLKFRMNYFGKDYLAKMAEDMKKESEKKTTEKVVSETALIEIEQKEQQQQLKTTRLRSTKMALLHKGRALLTARRNTKRLASLTVSRSQSATFLRAKNPALGAVGRFLPIGAAYGIGSNYLVDCSSISSKACKHSGWMRDNKSAKDPESAAIRASGCGNNAHGTLEQCHEVREAQELTIGEVKQLC